MVSRSSVNAVLVTVVLSSMALAGCTDPGTQGVADDLVDDVNKNLLGFLDVGAEVLIDGAHRGGEPSIAVDSKGKIYVSAPSGVVSTVFNPIADPMDLEAQGPQNRQSFLWSSVDGGKTWALEKLEIPMAPEQAPPVRDGDTTFGGGDTDVVVDACDNVYFTDLWVGNAAVSVKKAGSDRWQGMPITSALPLVDRQWLAVDTVDKTACGTVYLAFQMFTVVSVAGAYQQVQVIKSTDYGMTFQQQTTAINCFNSDNCYSIDGNLILDPKTKNLYLVLGGDGGTGTQVAISKDGGLTWSVVQSSKPVNDINNIFPVIASDLAGNLYVVWSEYGTVASVDETGDEVATGSFNVYLTVSTDQGATWSDRVSVSGPENMGTDVFPWVTAGADGRVAVAWYGNNESVTKTDKVKGDWYVYVTYTQNAASADAQWSAPVRLSANPMHKGEICTRGLYCTSGDIEAPITSRGNRNLADFFEIAINPEGHIVAAWSNDYATADQSVSVAYFGHQVGGINFLGLVDAPAVDAVAAG